MQNNNHDKDDDAEQGNRLQERVSAQSDQTNENHRPVKHQ